LKKPNKIILASAGCNKSDNDVMHKKTDSAQNLDCTWENQPCWLFRTQVSDRKCMSCMRRLSWARFNGKPNELRL